MITLNEKTRYQDLLSPEAVSHMPHPGKSQALIDDRMVPEEEALRKIAEVCLNAKKPVIFTPGRIILWTWEEGAPDKARVLRKLAAAIGAEILPIMDIRPNYPQMRTAVEINPYHGDLIIGHNRYDVAVFMAVDCPYADVALKIIKDGTDIYTIALCGKLGHVDATITLCQADLDKIEQLVEIINQWYPLAPLPSRRLRNLSRQGKHRGALAVLRADTGEPNSLFGAFPQLKQITAEDTEEVKKVWGRGDDIVG